VDGIGVGEYDATLGKIEAEDYFAADNTLKLENPGGGFMVSAGNGASYIGFHNVRGLKGKRNMTIRVSAPIPSDSEIEVRTGSPTGPSIAKFTIKTHLPHVFGDFTAELPDLEDNENLYFLMNPLDEQTVNLDYFLIH
jgi:hypothetical protein